MGQESVHDRLERIEDKVDKMADTIVALARVEEKIVGLEQTNSTLVRRMVSVDESLARIQDRMVGIELKQTLDGNTLYGLRKFFWILVSAIVGGAIMMWFSNMNHVNNPPVKTPSSYAQ